MKKYFTHILLASLSLANWLPARPQVQKVDAIGITVSQMDRSVRFYTQVLGFKKISDQEVYGEPYEELQGIFGVRMRIVQIGRAHV